MITERYLSNAALPILMVVEQSATNALIILMKCCVLPDMKKMLRPTTIGWPVLVGGKCNKWKHCTHSLYMNLPKNTLPFP